MTTGAIGLAQEVKRSAALLRNRRALLRRLDRLVTAAGVDPTADVTALRGACEIDWVREGRGLLTASRGNTPTLDRARRLSSREHS